MTSMKFIFCLMCLEKLAQVATKEFSPDRKTSVILSKAGQNLTLRCLYRDGVSIRMYWFKQPLGEVPRLLCRYDISVKNSAFFNNFKNNSRFQLHHDDKELRLTIADLEFSDSAVYYCADQYLHIFDFIHGYNVVVEGSESIQSGGSGILNCTVHTGTCDEDHTVYWFTHSGQSDLTLVYRHRGTKKQCEKKTNTCFYSLSMKNLNISQTGTFCAVEACGHILFGNGTKLECEEENLLWVCFLSAAWITTILVAVLLSIFMAKKRNSHHSLVVSDKDSQSRLPAVSTANTEGDKEEDSLHYAAVGIKRPNRSRMQRTSQNECVYSGVRQ